MEKRLPILGERTLEGVDTLYHRIGSFSLFNQEGVLFSEKDIGGRVYVADFFFTRCPTICPVMARQMRRVYEVFEGHEEFLLVSHTVDPAHDTPAILKEYASRLEVNDSQWIFLTGEADAIYALASQYLSVSMPDSTAPGGFLHSGAFLLMDRQRRIRGVYDGTSEEEVSTLLEDIVCVIRRKVTLCIVCGSTSKPS